MQATRVAAHLGVMRRRPTGAAEVYCCVQFDAKAFQGLAKAGSKALVARFAAIDYYRLDPQTITLIDNSKGFGHKETLEAPFPATTRNFGDQPCSLAFRILPVGPLGSSSRR